MRHSIRCSLAAVAMLLMSASARAGEISHFNPGVPNIRDFLVPSHPGFYVAVYNYYYTTDRLNDANGDKLRTINVNPGPGPGINFDVNVDVDIYALSPMLIWVSDWKILGARYAAYVAPTFANASLSAALSNQHLLGREASNDSFGAGDLLVHPLWLGWDVPHFAAALGYGFWAPVGQYDTAPVALPNGEVVRVESPDNLGFGYWTHQFQGAGAWYPWEDKRMAVVLTGTYEVNGDKEGYKLEPGQFFTLNWGISQYLPLVKDQSVLAELGLAGYDSWQTTDDHGLDARNNLNDSVHAAGAQIGVTHVPWGAVLNFHYFYEFESEDRFQGHVVQLSLAKKI